MILMVIPAVAAALISLRDVKQQLGINGEGKAAAGRARALSPAMNQGTATTTNATHSPGDPAGHGAFTYMVMYSVRAQSSRYIGLSRSSDTMPHRTTKCSFPVFPLRSHSFPSPLSSIYSFSSCLSSSSTLSSCFLLPSVPLHPP